MKSDFTALTAEIVLLVAVVSAPILIFAMIAVDVLATDETLTVTVDGMCCECVSRMAAAELRELNSVRNVRFDLPAKTLSVTVADTGENVVTDVWRTLQRCELRPELMVWRQQHFDEARMASLRGRQ